MQAGRSGGLLTWRNTRTGDEPAERTAQEQDTAMAADPGTIDPATTDTPARAGAHELVLLHGQPGSPADWHRVTARLPACSSSRTRVITCPGEPRMPSPTRLRRSWPRPKKQISGSRGAALPSEDAVASRQPSFAPVRWGPPVLQTRITVTDDVSAAAGPQRATASRSRAGCLGRVCHCGGHAAMCRPRHAKRRTEAKYRRPDLLLRLGHHLGAAFLTHAIESLNAWFPGRRRMLRARVPAAPGEPVGEIHGVAGAEDGRHEAGRLGRVCARADSWRG
jgi:hypothetical protein